MTAQIIDGKAIATDIRADVARRAAALAAKGVVPGLAAILVGDDPGSISYVTSKTAACAEAGIFSETFRLSAETTQAELLVVIDRLNRDPRFHGIVVNNLFNRGTGKPQEAYDRSIQKKEFALLLQRSGLKVEETSGAH